MKHKKSANFFLVFIAIMLGGTLFRQFDFENLKFEKPAIATLYIVIFLLAIYFLIRDYKNRFKE